MTTTTTTPARHNRAWTKPERETLAALVLQGKSDEEIGHTMGRTTVAIYAQRGRLWDPLDLITASLARLSPSERRWVHIELVRRGLL